MKVLSLTQPWATLVVLGAKEIETRSWTTSYRGPLLIHASKSYPGWAKECAAEEPFYSALRPGGIYSYPELGCGHIIGQVELHKCIRTSDVTEISQNEREFGDYAPGRFAWLLMNPLRLPPIPAKGSLGLWEFEMPEMPRVLTADDIERIGKKAAEAGAVVRGGYQRY